MYRNKYQPKILSLLLSAGSKPLEIWKTKTKKGCVRKVLDETIKLSAIEILSENTSDSYIYTAPHNFTSLAISLPIIVLIVKNMNKYFSFRISILDDKKCRRTFRISNFQTVTRLSNKWCTMPMVLNDGWNIIQIDLKDYTKKAFRTNYVETSDIQINASIRIRCIYFCDRIYKNEELKDEFKIFSKKKEKIKYFPPPNLIKPENKNILKNIKKEKIFKKEDDITNKGDFNREKTKNDKITNIENEEKTDLENKEKKDLENEEKTDLENEEKTDLENEEKTDLENEEKTDLENEEKTDLENKEKTDLENEEEENYLTNIIDDIIDEDDEQENNDNEDKKTVSGNTHNEEDNEAIINLTEIKNLEIDLNNVIYEDVNYDNYNNDDN